MLRYPVKCSLCVKMLRTQGSDLSLLDERGIFFLRLYLFLFRQRGREGEREGGKHQCMVASHTPLSRGMAPYPGMCRDWKLSLLPFASQAGTQSTEPHQPGLNLEFLTKDVPVCVSYSLECPIHITPEKILF